MDLAADRAGAGNLTFLFVPDFSPVKEELGRLTLP